MSGEGGVAAYRRSTIPIMRGLRTGEPHPLTLVSCVRCIQRSMHRGGASLLFSGGARCDRGQEAKPHRASVIRETFRGISLAFSLFPRTPTTTTELPPQPCSFGDRLLPSSPPSLHQPSPKYHPQPSCPGAHHPNRHHRTHPPAACLPQATLPEGGLRRLRWWSGPGLGFPAALRPGACGGACSSWQ